MDAKDILKLIKQLSNLNQEELARELGVSFVTLNSWINGRSIPHKKNQFKIDELYFKYSGTRAISKDVLEAKKEIVFKKSKKYKNIISFILSRVDIFNQFLLSLTYNTNKIEGSTLTLSETSAILFENVSIKNRSLIEQIEAKNHQAAFVFMFDFVNEKKTIDKGFILRLHAILMNSVRADAGLFRNHAVKIVGSNVTTANYLKVPALIDELVKDINKEKKDVIAHVSEIHARFEQIHPFSDGNGRIGRLLIQAMLLKKNYAPAMILQKDKKLYMDFLNKAQKEGDSTLLEDFLLNAVIAGFEFL